MDSSPLGSQKHNTQVLVMLQVLVVKVPGPLTQVNSRKP